MPHDLRPVARSGPEAKQKDNETKQADGSIRAGIILALGTGKRSNNDDRNGQSCASGDANMLGNVAHKTDTGIVPHPVHGFGDDGDWYVPKEETEHDAQPEQERDDPILVISMLDETGNPPPAS